MASEKTVPMTTEELKDLLGGCGVTNHLGYSEDLEELRAIDPTLAAEVVLLREALGEIAERHIPDQPAAYGGDETDWASRQHTELRRIARQALSQK